jgi:hypothetical protein
MVNMATKVERQLKRKGHIRPSFNSGFSSLWKMNLKRGEAAQPTKVKPLKAKVEVFIGFKGKSDTQPKRTHDVKCFRCH